MINPYTYYSSGFLLALLLYLLGWSKLYPDLSWGLIAFLAITIVVFGVLGAYVTRKKKVTFRSLPAASTKQAVVVTAFIFLLWTLEFMHARGVPLLKIILAQPYDYRTFGVPSLHVFVVTFSSFYTVYLVHVYLSGRSRLVLLLVLINLSAALLIYNRGMLLFNLCGCVSVYLIERQNKLTIRHGAAALAGVLLLFYLFGVLGSLRVSREARKPYTNADFLNIGRASESFRSSVVPDEFFWTYIYISSPLANLQENTAAEPGAVLSTRRLALWFNNEVLPDFVSKRINRVFNVEPFKERRIPGPFNATTIYSRSYSYLGWLGLVLMAFTLFAVPIIYFRVLPPHSPFALAGVAIVNTILLFSVFVNTISFTGLSFQLVYPVLLHYLPARFVFPGASVVNNKVTTDRIQQT